MEQLSRQEIRSAGEEGRGGVALFDPRETGAGPSRVADCGSGFPVADYVWRRRCIGDCEGREGEDDG